jgi:uncharacterized membrane protein
MLGCVNRPSPIRFSAEAALVYDGGGMATPQHEHELGTGRIEAFSDGVFAIAITLLIIEIAVPHVDAREGLGDALLDEWPSYFAYVLSFITIGIYWANHHSFYRLFLRTNHTFLMLNVFFLMCIAFLPFPTAVLAEYLQDGEHRGTAVTLYSLGLLLPAFGWFLVWLYGRAAGLIDERLETGFVRFLTWQYVASIAIYGTALGVSFASGTAAIALCVAITAVYLFPPRRPQYAG